MLDQAIEEEKQAIEAKGKKDKHKEKKEL